MPASELFYKFEAYLLSHPAPPSSFKPGQPAQPKLTLDIARELKKEFQRDLAAKNVAGVRAPTGAGWAAVTPGAGTAGTTKKRMSGVGLDGLCDPSLVARLTHESRANHHVLFSQARL